jgi:excisionase family DNA binding protein
MENQLVVTLHVNELKDIITQTIENVISKNPSKKEDDILLKRVDVARLFSVSLVTITEWMKTGKLPYHRINSRVYFKKSELMECMELKDKYKRKK